MLSKQSKPMEKVSSLGDLGPLLPDLAVCRNMDVIFTLDNFVHRLCGFQQVRVVPLLFKKKIQKNSSQIHAIFRANWHYSKEPLDPFNTFMGLDKLEERGTKALDVIKIEDLLFQVVLLLFASVPYLFKLV